jgi:hypothetical protein
LRSPGQLGPSTGGVPLTVGTGGPPIDPNVLKPDLGNLTPPNFPDLQTPPVDQNIVGGGPTGTLPGTEAPPNFDFGGGSSGVEIQDPSGNYIPAVGGASGSSVDLPSTIDNYDPTNYDVLGGGSLPGTDVAPNYNFDPLAGIAPDFSTADTYTPPEYSSYTSYYG